MWILVTLHLHLVHNKERVNTGNTASPSSAQQRTCEYWWHCSTHLCKQRLPIPVDSVGQVPHNVPTGWAPLLSCKHNSWLVACLTSQQHASVSQGRICSDNFTCCHTETEVADQTFYLTQLKYTNTGPTSPSAGVSIFKSLVWLDPEKSRSKRDSNPGSSTLEADALTTRPKRM